MSLLNITNDAAQHGRSELNRIGYLDGWRGLAILLVLLAHFLRVKQIDVGRLGVDLFFVLSGMLMANILFVKKVPLSVFYKRRISRIFPVFFIYISLVSLASAILSLSDEHWNYIYNLLFIRSYYPASPDIWHTGMPNEHLWSLNVEEHCYILLSLLTLIPFIVKRSYFFIGLFGCSAILLHYIYVWFPQLATENYHLRTEIVASHLMISAAYSLIKHNFEPYIPTWSPILTMILAVSCYSEYSIHWSAKWTLSPFLMAFTINHLSLAPEGFKSLLSWPLLRIIGIWSFSIYLWQQPFYFYGVKFKEAFEYAGPVLMVASIFVGAISFYLIENPIRRYLNNNW